MVLGLRSKHRRAASVKVNYIVSIQEISPWPPSESLRSIQAVLLQWENGNQYSGTFLSTPQDSRIIFNESFKLPLILYQDKKARDKFQKNILEFSLFVARKDKLAKGQLLGTAVINLADYGVIEDVLTVNASLNLKRSFTNSLQKPSLVISVEPVEKSSSNSSPSVGLSKEPSLDNDDLEIESFTDDDDSSQSSRTANSSAFEVVASSPSYIEKNGYENSGFAPGQSKKIQPSSTDNALSDTGSQVNINFPGSKFYDRSMTSVEKNSETPFTKSSLSSISFQDINRKPKTSISSLGNTQQSVEEKKSIEKFEPEATSADDSPKDVQINSTHIKVNVEEKMEPQITENEIIGKLSEGNGLLDLDIHEETQKKDEICDVIEGKEVKGETSDCKNEWKARIEMLEEELRETAAIEIGLYSVVADHVSSGNKVHAPARRVARFYTDACKTGSQAKRASAARAAVSGLVLVSKSCGNDVPRLTFWLSNSIMLRSTISQIAAELPHFKSNDQSDDSEDVSAFILALENVESWLFSRIVESIWWQSFTPHMQPTVARGSEVTKKTCGRRNSLSNHTEQGNFSIELWKKAFRDACERLCPIRAGRHECGCLSVLVRLVMEQLINRLDLAMFNAILRESADEMPTDPLSDPISDPKVLPIPAGKSSFGAGVELKNSIGNWSRWLTDIFSIEDDLTDHNDVRLQSFKPFRLLHALSDLMMLPFGMLADASTRKEVCPMFGPVIIRRALINFVPDEFCPDPIPQDIIDALDDEEVSESASGDLLTFFPCTAGPMKYLPPSAALLTCVGEVGNQVLQSSRLSSLKKSYNSDDELDELDSPLTSIIPDSLQTSALAKLSLISKEKSGRNIVRYQLLREVWKDGE